MKLLILLSALALNAEASTLNLFCKSGEGLTDCGAKAEAAVTRLGCSLVPSETNCHFTLREDPKNPGSTVQTDSPYCELSSANCSRPHTGIGEENCVDREKVEIAREAGVHNGYWFGFFGDYSRTVCRAR
jgi:hypothetical protein